MMSLVWELTLPDSEKLVLLALADCADDEGVCWPSISTLARKCTKSERTVQCCIRSLEQRGHLGRKEIAGKGCRYLVHPIVMFGTPAAAAPRRDCTPAEDSPVQPLHQPPQGLHPTPAAAAPKPSKNHKKPSPITTAHALPDDWEPVEFSVGSESRKVIDGWPPGEFGVQLEKFRAQHGKKGDKFVDWQKAWSTWVLNTRIFGVGVNERRTNSLGRHQPADGISSTARAALAVFGSGEH
jgi:hypothetical protein